MSRHTIIVLIYHCHKLLHLLLHLIKCFCDVGHARDEKHSHQPSVLSEGCL
jgi:hypothetical protein